MIVKRLISANLKVDMKIHVIFIFFNNLCRILVLVDNLLTKNRVRSFCFSN